MILDWAEDMCDEPISESDIQRFAAKENWVDMANFNMQLGSKLCATPRPKWVLSLGKTDS